jgi:hypothetical protein
MSKTRCSVPSQNCHNRSVLYDNRNLFGELGPAIMEEKILLADSLHKQEGLEAKGGALRPARVGHPRGWCRRLGETLCIADARDACLLSRRSLR